MKIGIIGAGRIGGTLTRRLTALGHDVTVANSRDPDTLSDLEVETGATAAWAREVPRGQQKFRATGESPGTFAEPARRPC